MKPKNNLEYELTDAHNIPYIKHAPLVEQDLPFTAWTPAYEKISNPLFRKSEICRWPTPAFLNLVSPYMGPVLDI